MKAIHLDAIEALGLESVDTATTNHLNIAEAMESTFVQHIFCSQFVEKTEVKVRDRMSRGREGKSKSRFESFESFLIKFVL
jgi:hypothetical protein